MKTIKIACCILTIGILLCLPVYVNAAQVVVMQDVDFGVANKQDFNVGYTQIKKIPIWWESSTPWAIYVESQDSNLGSSDDGTYIKPLGDLMFKMHEASGNQWQSMLTQPQLLYQSSSTGTGTIRVDWRILVSWTADRPGQYGADLLLTISDV